MSYFAKIDQNNFFIDAVLIPNEFDNVGEDYINKIYNTSDTWVQCISLDNATDSATYSFEKKIFVLDQELGETNDSIITMPPTLPAAAPEDATWLIGFEPQPENYENFTTKRSYFWIEQYNQWGLLACGCNPPPQDDNHYEWNYLDYTWDIVNSQKPDENYFWEPRVKEWLEIPGDAKDIDHAH